MGEESALALFNEDWHGNVTVKYDELFVYLNSLESEEIIKNNLVWDVICESPMMVESVRKILRKCPNSKVNQCFTLPESEEIISKQMCHEYLLNDRSLNLIPIGRPLIKEIGLYDEKDKKVMAGRLGSLKFSHYEEDSLKMEDLKCRGKYLSDGTIYLQSVGETIEHAENSIGIKIIIDSVKAFDNVAFVEYCKVSNKARLEIGLLENDGQRRTKLVEELKNSQIFRYIDSRIMFVEKDGVSIELQMSSDNEEMSGEALRVSHIVCNVMGVQHLTLEDNLFDYGLDSIKITQLVMQLKETGYEVEIAEIYKNPSIGDLMNLCRESENTLGTLKKNVLNVVESGVELIKSQSDLEKVKTWMAEDLNIEKIYPVTYIQEAILAQNIHFKNTGKDLNIVQYQINSNIDLEIFKKSWSLVFDLHPILRTGFAWRRLKEPLQFVHKSVELPFEYVDFSERNEAEKETEIRNKLQQELLQSFDIKKPPLLKLILIKISNQSYKFLIKMQASLFDGWSMNIIINDLLSIYESMMSGETYHVEKREAFLDYVKWLNKTDFHEAKCYWKKEFDGLKVNNYNQSENREIYGAYKGCEEKIVLSENHFSRLIEFAQKNRITPYTVFLSAWISIQFQMRKEEELIFNTVVAGRPYELENSAQIAGLFSNTLPLKINKLDIGSGLDRLKNIQRKNIERRSYEHISIHQISEWTDLPLELFQESIYNNTLVYLNFPQSEKISSEMNLRTTKEEELGQVNVPLRCYIEPHKDCKVIIKFDENYYSKETIKELIVMFEDEITKTIDL